MRSSSRISRGEVLFRKEKNQRPVEMRRKESNCAWGDVHFDKSQINAPTILTSGETWPATQTRNDGEDVVRDVSNTASRFRAYWQWRRCHSLLASE